jgi:hypothetical protein
MSPPRTGSSKDYVTGLMALVKAKNPGETEFHQAVAEVVESLSLVLDRHPEYRAARILERIVSRSACSCSGCRGSTTAARSR